MSDVAHGPLVYTDIFSSETIFLGECGWEGGGSQGMKVPCNCGVSDSCKAIV
jgi:hypothetical protein